MINGPVIGGFLIAGVLVWAALFFGTWFHSAVEFSDGHSLDMARVTRPVICSFKIEDYDGVTTGMIRSRDGLMRFDIRGEKNAQISQWGIEVDMVDGSRMMSQASPDDSFVSLDDYPNLRVQVLEDLKRIMLSDKIHCAPWWSASSFRFELQGHL